ncbi:8-oxo-dGTP diphosphatase MutT [Aliivibrio sp. S4TY2]|uniref:8-oxo-dGTP diphosphatase MutT n=1 Tax=unclassified Aliivibrio TaxID=2645654 RepID=UPI002377EB60|nr:MULTISPECIES: 8-oxo-dGTP diphosphatase MutT [unclassified Aliivibrio]MDD9155907.1 8-oxo-dGTP diphosphatase MutT [Aliivibrio sp. S4TY2]MDD9159413.1 8-oxo-dGTP diphosphatase MutT [Aliivibrio sp. S4TY1]MDD9163615.1 8-oxo-dGTP diphosphatase MutT [Aliivibrio sp. S4MY2]MDD9167616.1 8-oxo-dGTP diphosphatase MutT [Aliivibrio sp. S4MY4]MDD9186140.1 8-oxo-dGTP diphosphatase MutT [Aliivibrio sp. S4MY3]
MKRLHIVAAIILNAEKNQVFITKRPDKAHKGGFWEFPGGKVEVGESAEQALIRELYEEIGINSTELDLFESLNHDYSDKSLYFDFFTVTQFEDLPYGKEGQEGIWVSISDLKGYDFPEANVPVLNKVIELFS